MAYTVLARKWRPKRFEDLVGQEHILKIIANSLELQRLHHAYLFCGTRGVGKTTLARIFAKCLNCENGITATPCNECGACVQIDKGQFVDLIEIDAASRTKVEDTRELLENVQYSPTSGRYKVYLIDEVHMLSTHSFNALLKTLEEPPPHVIFILATTDPQKLPITILSRCLKLQLQMLSEEQIASHLSNILASESIEAEPDALEQLATAAKGSVRDSLSLTDQAIVYCDGSINAKAVRQMLGLVSQEHIWTLITALKEQNCQAMLDTVHTMELNADNFITTTESLQTAFYQMTLYQMDPTAIASRTPNYAEIKELSEHFSAQELQLYYQILTVGKSDILLAPTPKVGFEMLLMRLFAFIPAQLASSSQNIAMKQPQTAITEHGAQPPKNPVQSIDKDNWHSVVTQLKISGMTKILASHCTVGIMQNDQLDLCISDAQGSLATETQMKLLSTAVSDYLGKPVRVSISKAQEADQETPIKRQQREQNDQLNKAQSSLNEDSNVKNLMDMFDASVDTTSIETNN